MNLDETSNIKKQTDKSYRAIFEGEFLKSKSHSISKLELSNLQSIGKAKIYMDDIEKLFDGEVVLSLDDPHLIIETEIKGDKVRLQVSVAASYEKESENNQWKSDPFYVTSEKPYIWIGQKPYIGDKYDFFEWPDLPLLLLNPPKVLEMELFAEAPIGVVGYILEVELTPTIDFQATTVQRIENAFDESLVKSLFSSGETIIYGEMKNTLPLDVEVVMHILNEQNRPIGINIPAQKVVGESDKVAFIISEEDMPKMVDARHIELEMKLRGREKPVSLKSDQTLEMELKIHKKGGVSL